MKNHIVHVLAAATAALALSLSACQGMKVTFAPLPVKPRAPRDRDAYSVPRETVARQERLLRERRRKEKEDQETREEAQKLAETIRTPEAAKGLDD